MFLQFQSIYIYYVRTHHSLWTPEKLLNFEGVWQKLMTIFIFWITSVSDLV